MKCCPEQLRRASPREELLESLAEDKQAPWSFTKVAEEIGGNQYQDISGERPETEELLSFVKASGTGGLGGVLAAWAANI